MTRTFSFLFLFLFLASCGKGGSGGSTGMGNLSDAEISASGSAPAAAQTFDINAQMTGFDRGQEDKILKAFELIKRVVASDEFKAQVLNKSYKGKKQFFDNDGKSNAQIYKAILEGSEMLTPGRNNAMDLKLETYHEANIVIGYTKPNITTIYMNTKYLDQTNFQVNEVAMNLTHEWLHKLGFKHSQNNTPARPHSVPYAVGYIMRALAAKYI
jgi:hypothetical protein